MIGIAKAAVLPVPVCAWPMRSSPRRRGGIARAWTSVGVTNPISSIARAIVAGTSISPNRYAPAAASAAATNGEWSSESVTGSATAVGAVGCEALRAAGVDRSPRRRRGRGGSVSGKEAPD
jgi:hypothetical protein